MRKTKKPSHKLFRYLTKKEFKDPLYAIADFCVNTIDLRDWKSNVDLIVKIACTSPKGLKWREISNLHHNWSYLCKQIDFLYLLKHRVKNWTLTKDSRFYNATFYYGSTLLYDPDLRRGTYMEFDRLKKGEIKNLEIYIDKFFGLMSYWQWQKLMDRLLSTFFDNSQIGQYVAYDGKDSKIFRLLEKLGEAMYLIYLSKAKEHIAKHYPDDDRVAHYYKSSYIDVDDEEETVVEKEDPEADDEPLKQGILASENPAPNETDDDT